MSETWIAVSERILDQIQQLEVSKERDRLELVRSIHFMLSALQRSLLGWMQWVNSPEIMVRFTQEDLINMNRQLSGFTRSFIKYDLEATKLGAQKGLKTVTKFKQKKKEKENIFYV